MQDNEKDLLKTKVINSITDLIFALELDDISILSKKIKLRAEEENTPIVFSRTDITNYDILNQRIDKGNFQELLSKTPLFAKYLGKYYDLFKKLSCKIVLVDESAYFAEVLLDFLENYKSIMNDQQFIDFLERYAALNSDCFIYPDKKLCDLLQKENRIYFEHYNKEASLIDPDSLTYKVFNRNNGDNNAYVPMFFDVEDNYKKPATNRELIDLIAKEVKKLISKKFEFNVVSAAFADFEEFNTLAYILKNLSCEKFELYFSQIMQDIASLPESRNFKKVYYELYDRYEDSAKLRDKDFNGVLEFIGSLAEYSREELKEFLNSLMNAEKINISDVEYSVVLNKWWSDLDDEEELDAHAFPLESYFYELLSNVPKFHLAEITNAFDDILNGKKQPQNHLKIVKNILAKYEKIKASKYCTCVQCNQSFPVFGKNRTYCYKCQPAGSYKNKEYKTQRQKAYRDTIKNFRN